MVSAKLQAQSKKELSAMLNRNLDDYRKYSLALNFDSSLQFMPPKMFELVPMDTLKATMVQAMDNEYMKIEMTGFTYTGDRKIKLKKAGKYSWTFVPYTGSMRLNLRGESSFKQMLLPMMKSQFGTENVVVTGDSILDITFKNKKLIAFKDPALSRWSIIEDKRSEKGQEGERQKVFFEAIMPPEILKAITPK